MKVSARRALEETIRASLVAVRRLRPQRRSAAKVRTNDGGSPIIVDVVDEDFTNDPNIRGASGSVFRAGTDTDRADFIKWRDEGMSNHEATQNLAHRIARRSQRVIESVQEEM